MPLTNMPSNLPLTSPRQIRIVACSVVTRRNDYELPRVDSSQKNIETQADFRLGSVTSRIAARLPVIGGAIRSPNFPPSASTFANEFPRLCPLLFSHSSTTSSSPVPFLNSLHRALLTLPRHPQNHFQYRSLDSSRRASTPPSLPPVLKLPQNACLCVQSGSYGQEGRQTREEDSSLQTILQSQFQKPLHKRLESLIRRR